MSNDSTTTTTVSPVSFPASADAPSPRLAYAALSDERAALREDELLQVNLDMHAAAITALGSYGEIAALRELAAELPGFDPKLIDQLPVYASGAYHAQTIYDGATGEPKELKKLNEQATELRDVLHGEVDALKRRGRIDPNALREYKGMVGYRVVSADLNLLTKTIREYLAKYPEDARFSLAEIEAAESLVQRIITAVGTKDLGPAINAAATVDRQRAFTLFVRTYEAVRRAVGYLRWNERDADTIAPSLHTVRYRAGSKRRDDDAADDAPATPTPTTPDAAPAAPVSGLRPFAS